MHCARPPCCRPALLGPPRHTHTTPNLSTHVAPIGSHCHPRHMYTTTNEFLCQPYPSTTAVQAPIPLRSTAPTSPGTRCGQRGRAAAGRRARAGCTAPPQTRQSPTPPWPRWPTAAAAGSAPHGWPPEWQAPALGPGRQGMEDASLKEEKGALGCGLERVGEPAAAIGGRGCTVGGEQGGRLDNRQDGALAHQPAPGVHCCCMGPLVTEHTTGTMAASPAAPRRWSLT